jgi:hypothetical protein
MDAGNGKSRDFGLSQALANQVVRKGVCGDFILCGLSPPVSASWSLVHRYTFWTASARNPNTYLKAMKTSLAVILCAGSRAWLPGLPKRSEAEPLRPQSGQPGRLARSRG